ncbi:MAG: thioredoxin fold domain-containing protein [Candidatus Obscuribacterales bacterium]|nr:thioredoxin fold domain-containing protein [Candidatus Obscuribacterales bacterium]
MNLYQILFPLLLVALLAVLASSLGAQKPMSEASSGPSEVIIFSDTMDAKTEFENSDLPVVVDFYATWCGPCKLLAPEIDKLASEYKGKVKVYKVDVDKFKALTKSYGIKGYPTVIFIKPKNASRTVQKGLASYEKLKELTEETLK